MIRKALSDNRKEARYATNVIYSWRNEGLSAYHASP